MKSGQEELRKLIQEKVEDSSHMNLLLNSLTDFNEHIKEPQMREQIKMFGVAAEEFEEEIVLYIPKILQLLMKQIKEDAMCKLHCAISETIGNLVLHSLNNLDSLYTKVELFENQFL